VPATRSTGRSRPVAYVPRGVDPNGASFASVWEEAPRRARNNEARRFALEVQVTTAQYTATLDDHFAPDPADNEDSVTNVRRGFSVFLFF
jgi:hypothetical protein